MWIVVGLYVKVKALYFLLAKRIKMTIQMLVN